MKRLVVLLMILALVLAGCSKDDEQKKDAGNDIAVEAVADAEDDSSVDEVIETDSDEITDEEVAIDDSEVEEIVEEAEESQDEEYDYENNGHYFVRFGDEVYFHIASGEDYSSYTSISDFCSQPAGETSLIAYNPDNGETNFCAVDDAYGPIAVEHDWLYYSDSEFDGNVIAVRDNGDEWEAYETLGKRVLGATADNSMVILFSTDTEVMKVHFYSEGCEKYAYEVSGEPIIVATDSDHIFYIEWDISTYTPYLTQMDIATGATIRLGTVPDNYDISASASEPVQGLVQDGKVYCSFGYYEGSGHFLCGSTYVEAEIDCEDSLNVCEPDGIEDKHTDLETQIPGYYVSDGEMIATYYTPNSAVVMDGYVGYIDENGDWNAVADGFDEKYTEEGATVYEVVERIGDDIYLLCNEMEHVPSEDIGWRYAYRRLKTSVIKVNINSGESEVLMICEI